MKKIIIKYLIRYLFKKHFNNITDIVAYLCQLESYWKRYNNNKTNNQFCLDIARLRKWLFDNIIIYLDKEYYDLNHPYIIADIISHINNDRYTINDYINFVENYRKGLIKIDDISKL